MIDFKAVNQQLDLIDFCEANKIKSNKVNSREWELKCPAHRDRKPSFAYNTVKKVGHCFVCKFKADGLGFVAKYYNLDSMVEAVKILKLFVSEYVSADKSVERTIQSFKDARKIKAKQNKWRGQLPLRTELTSLHAQGMRQLKLETIEKFDLRVDAANERVAIPITYKAALVGLQWYSQQQNEEGLYYWTNKKGEQKIVKKYHIEHGFNKAKFLFGYDQALPSIIDRGAVILVEGAYCTMAAHEKGYPNTVCSFGANLSVEQAALLRDVASKIYLCYDNDAAGRKGAFEAMIELGPGVEVKLCALPTLKDVYDLGADEFDRIIKEAI